MQAYYKKRYIETIDPYGTTRTRWIYGHYNSVVDMWSFKDNDGSTLINMCFEDTSENKLTCIYDIYTGNNRIEITQEEYNNINITYEDF